MCQNVTICHRNISLPEKIEMGIKIRHFSLRKKMFSMQPPKNDHNSKCITYSSCLCEIKKNNNNPYEPPGDWPISTVSRPKKKLLFYGVCNSEHDLDSVPLALFELTIKSAACISDLELELLMWHPFHKGWPRISSLDGDTNLGPLLKLLSFLLLWVKKSVF